MFIVIHVSGRMLISHTRTPGGFSNLRSRYARLDQRLKNVESFGTE